jgi:hypothetical protein
MQGQIPLDTMVEIVLAFMPGLPLPNQPIRPDAAARLQQLLGQMAITERPDSSLLDPRKLAPSIEGEEKKKKRKIKSAEPPKLLMSLPDEETLLALKRDSMVRLVRAESSLRIGKIGETLRHQLLARTVAQHSVDDSAFAELAKHISEDFKSRLDLAVQWLAQEYVNQFIHPEKQAEQQSRYQFLFMSFLRGIAEAFVFEKSDRVLSSFLVRVPFLPREAFSFIEEFCNGEAR